MKRTKGAKQRRHGTAFFFLKARATVLRKDLTRWSEAEGDLPHEKEKGKKTKDTYAYTLEQKLQTYA